MGNTQSITDYTPEQYSEKGMREIGFILDQKIHLGGPFFIEGQNPKNGIYGFRLYHHDNTNIFTEFFSFETFHPLNNDYKVVYDSSIIKFVFETDSFEKRLKHVLEYSFDFSKSFQSENDFSSSMKSIPFLLHPNRKMINLHGKYWYYLISIDAIKHEFYIVESSSAKTGLGFESTFNSGDTVIKKINMESSNFPFVTNDNEGNFLIASADEGFVMIRIDLPSDDMTLTQMLSQ